MCGRARQKTRARARVPPNEVIKAEMMALELICTSQPMASTTDVTVGRRLRTDLLVERIREKLDKLVKAVVLGGVILPDDEERGAQCGIHGQISSGMS